MNKNNLHQIFQHYIERFEDLNGGQSHEYFKWKVCNDFPGLMNKALNSSDDEFAKALLDVKKCTSIIIDGYTLPCAALVEYAKIEPSTVRNILNNLYSDDGGDIKIQMEIIADFFKQCNELHDKYYPESYLYKQDSHSVSSLLFLNDPDHHYMYKAMQSQRFADGIEFYDDWGTGDNIALDKYYRMCDELVNEINNCPELLATNESRYDGRLNIQGKLHPDKEKHILAFDIIYCCSVYDLFDGITYTKRNLKEKKLYLAEKEKALNLKASYDDAKRNNELLEEALQEFVDMISIGKEIFHKKYGEGIVEEVDEKYIVGIFNDKEIKVSLPVALANGIILIRDKDFEDKIGKYRDVLKRYENIPLTLEYASRALAPYESYLE